MGLYMSYIEDASKELFDYYPPLTKRGDFDKFWQYTISEARKTPLCPEKKLYNYPGSYVDVFDISFNGFDETRIHGWYIVPKFGRDDKMPCIIHYHGFCGNRGRPADFMQWAMLGVAVLSVDCRGQNGDTGDAAKYSHGNTQSVICKGVLNKEEYYFRAVYMDCLKAIDFACIQDEVDVNRIIVEGGSQGGALATAMAALDDRVYMALCDVPSNSNIEERIKGSHGSFSSVTDYLKVHSDKVDRVFETLSYFDTMNMADRIKCRVLASVGLKDNVCPAKCYFATYNRIKGEKDVKIYPFNGHEGGGAIHNEIKLRLVDDIRR